MDDTLNSAPCGFLSFEDDGTVRAANATLLNLLGANREDVEGRHISDLLAAGGRVFYQTHLFPLLKLHGRVDEIYLSLRCKGGEDLPVLVNGVRRTRVDDTAINICVILPMRQRRRYEDELLQARKAADEAVRERERANAALKDANVELEARQEALRIQQSELLELNAQLSARAEREALLNRIGQTLRSTGEPDVVLESATTLLGEALGADRCFFVEYDVAGDQAQVTADWRRPDLPSLRGVYRISDFDLNVSALYGPSGVLSARDIKDSAAGKAFSPKAAAAVGALGMRSRTGVALFESGTPVASLNVAMAETPRDWTSDEVELVQAVATLIRLVTEEVRIRAKEHRIAEHLQAALQPALPGRIAGLDLAAYYQTALTEASIGGDFYDVFPIEKGCYTLVVADLSGKGLQAAAQIATVRHMLRSQLYQQGSTLAQAITTLNQILTEYELLSGFATLFVGAYDVNRRILTYVNAGQEPGLIRRAATGTIERLAPTGPVLGGVAGAEYVEAIVPLAYGDVLALFTDGLTEAGLNRKELLEIEGVEDIFRASSSAQASGASAQEIAERIMAGVTAAVTPAGIRDDVCLLVAKAN